MKKLAFALSILMSAWAVDSGAVPAPDFALPDEAGNEISLNTYKGNVIVLEWTNYDCPFVKKHYKSGNIPKLQKWAEEKGAIWLSINSSAEGKQGFLKQEESEAAMKKAGSNAVHLLRDYSGYIGRIYGAQTTPHIFVINKKGNIVYRGAVDSIASPFIKDLDRAEDYVTPAVTAALEKDPVEIPVTVPYGCSVKY